MPIVKLSLLERRRLSAFFTCLVFAALAWLFLTFSNTYNYTVRQVVNYRNMPQKRAFHPLQPDTLMVTTQGTGWQMLFSKVNEVKPIDIDLTTLDYRNYVVVSSQLKQINTKQPVDQQILATRPDTLYFDFSNRAVKKVPVQLLLNVKYQDQFGQSNDIRIRPAYITVSGPDNKLNGIKNWDTDTLKRDSVDGFINTIVNLKNPPEGNMAVYPKTVQVVVPVDEYTEKTLELPVKVLNNATNRNIKIFPQKVKVTFTVSLRRYAETDEDFFDASVDLSLWSSKGYSVLPVTITRQPKYCRIVKIEPQNIDFIVKK